MIIENAGDGTPPILIARIRPDDFPLTSQDVHELRAKRGFSAETIEAAKLGSIRNQADLERLGLDWKFDELPSTIVIPYGPADETGTYLFRLHKRSLPGTAYPPYVVLPRRDVDQVVLAESEFKALAAWQLGYNAVGLQGIQSHVHRIDALLTAIQALECSRVLVCLDTVRPALEGDNA